MTKATVLTGAAVMFGFMVGFAIGQKTRNAAASNVQTNYNDGKVIITADVQAALKTGVAGFISELTG